MKIIGKNSLSQYTSYILYTLFILVLAHFIYEIIGHLILFYKFKTGSNMFPDTFILGKEVGWAKNKWTIPMNDLLKFRINYPFTERQVITGIYGSSQIIYNGFGFLYLTLFFYFSFKSFKEMSSEKVFNPDAIKWLKRFGFLNLVFALVALIPILVFAKLTASNFFQITFLGFLGIIVLFIVEFFKKGYELQSENDLTI